LPLQRYLTYLQGKRDERGLLAIGLGDWCQPRRSREGDYTTPLVVTDTIVAADIAAKAAQIYKVLSMTQQAEFAAGMYEDLRNCVRKHLIDRETGTVYGATQTGQAIALAYGMFEEDEKEKAVNRLLALIGEKDGFMDTGVIGARVIFRVLADHGYADLAYHMITRPEYPSYGNWMMRGAITLWEGFWEENAIRYLSMNHHFWGDVSAWFYMYLAGIRIQPGEVTVKPCFVKKLSWVKASYQLPEGKLTVQWERTEDKIELEVTAPETVRLSIDAPGARIKRIGY
jgi:alpha-L-rhamnosidase